jgi:hypothetical protein
MSRSPNFELQTDRDARILNHMKSAPGSVLSAELAKLEDATGKKIPITAVRDSLKRLLDAGKIFTAGHKRSARYGSTQKKADIDRYEDAPAAA